MKIHMKVGIDAMAFVFQKRVNNSEEEDMTIAVWIIQVVVALAFLMAGGLKLTQKRTALAGQMAWVEDFSDLQVRGIGGLEVLGGIGLLLPSIFRIAPVLSALAASGLVLVMLGSIVVHVRRGEANRLAPNIVLLLLAAFVAWARFGQYHL